MSNNSDFEIIKKKYGEKFAQLCRKLFPSILENEKMLSQLIVSTFAPSKFLYDDLLKNMMVEDFENYIYSKYRTLFKENKVESEKVTNPYFLMKKAGYTLYKCKNNKDVQKFKKYWKKDEELCTFKDKNDRTTTNLVFFAVKNGAKKLKRKDFTHPKRQDEYGTSVISIQFSKSENCTLSIKNRYNHTVENPDATFSNDLENIYAGLTESFTKTFNINLVIMGGKFELPHYVMANDGVLYPYNMEINNMYFCSNNIIIENGEAEQYDKSRYEVIDYFLIDKQEKTITCLINQEDSFIDAFQDIEKIEIEALDKNRFIKVTTKDGEAEITVDERNRMIGYTNNYITSVEKSFLFYNTNLIKLNTPALTTIKNRCLFYNTSLTELFTPSLTKVGNFFLYYNEKRLALYALALTKVGDYCLYNNEKMRAHVSWQIEKNTNQNKEENE